MNSVGCDMDQRRPRDLHVIRTLNLVRYIPESFELASGGRGPVRCCGIST